MKKPLLTCKRYGWFEIACRAPVGCVLLFLTTCLFLINPQRGFSQDPPSGGYSVDCNCLDNESQALTGQFTSEYTIVSNPGETWEVANAVEIYNPLTVNPIQPVAIMNGATATEVFVNVTTSNYIFEWLHLDGSAYSFTLQNMADPQTEFFDISGPVSGCRYPRAEIMGEAFVCGDEELPYAVEDLAQATYSWTLSGGGAFTSPTNQSSVTVAWNDVPGGPHELEVTVSTIQGCVETTSLFVEIEDIIPLACNNNINLSMDINCEVQLTADMILEDMQYDTASYDIVLVDLAADTIVPNGIINGNYIGVELQVRVTQICGGNSCWGIITVEDKTVPELECSDVTIHCSEDIHPLNTGLPLPMNTNYAYNGDDTWIVFDFDACGESTLTFFDQVDNLNCQGNFAAVVTRTWKLTDGSGSMSTCVQSIYTELADINDLVLPPNFDGTEEPYLDCKEKDQPGGWISLPNGHPSPETTGSPQGATCLNLIVDFTDTKIPICGTESFKIARRWQIWDICTDQTIIHNQKITVLDTEGPICVAPNEFDVYTNPGACDFTIDVPAPNVIFDCSDWDYTVHYKVRDESGNPFLFPIDDGVVPNGDGTFSILNIPFESDSIWIIYTLTDLCGNQTQCFTEAALHDLEEPVAVCDLHTVVAVNEDGCGYADVYAFDDGSWDNCEIGYFEIRRMESFSCGVVNTWDETAKFCCDDIGNTVLVQLRVYDAFGNSNSCMVEVEVQDNRPPDLTFCPSDVTIDCNDDYLNLTQYGTAEFADNCEVTITETSVPVINNCGVGYIDRIFTGTDPSGNTAQCIQRIYIQPLDPFYINDNNPNDPTDDVIWPADYTVFGCLNLDTDPDDLPSGFDRPQTLDASCSQVAIDHDDVVFQIVEDACFKILRTWTIIDWCQFDQFNPTRGIWHYTQVIKILNTTAPTITEGCTDIVLEGTPNGCSSSVVLTAEAEDDCTAQDDLVWSYTVDVFNDGSIDYTGNRNNASRTYPFGTHKVTWTVEDQCGNQTSCMQFVTIRDGKAPTPICLDGIVTVLMPTTGTVTIWASDFLKQALDNCTAEHLLDVSFSTNPLDGFKTFSCADLENGVVDTFELRVYLTDEAGNQDFCTTHVIIQDNSDVCENTGTALIQVAGAVFTETDHMLEDIDVSLMSGQPEFPIQITTEADGHYAFQNLPMYENYTVEPAHGGNPLNGVTTLDLVLIQRHILGTKLFDSPYKVIAADANASESVSASDVVQLRKLILGLIDELPNNSSWKFVDADQEFEDVLSPFPFMEYISMDLLDHDEMAADFVAVKIGDVNESVELSFGQASTANRGSENQQLLIDDLTFDAGGHTIEVPVRIGSQGVWHGVQFTMAFDHSLLRFAGIEGGALEMDASHTGLQDVSAGQIHVSWSRADRVMIDAEDVLFTMRFEPLSDGQLSHTLSLSKHTISSEAYVGQDATVVQQPLVMVFHKADGDLVEENTFKLYQNIPNPFTDKTSIGFQLPESGDATLTLFDVNGRVIRVVQGHFEKGYNALDLDFKDIDATGILYYQLETKTHSANRKMIVIK